MGEVISIEKPLDNAIEEIKRRQARTREFVGDLEKIRNEQLAILKQLKAEGIDQAEETKSEMAEIEDAIKWGRDAIERSEQLIYKFMQRKARLSGEKTFEIKIR